ncbi:MAG: tetratricopeptide repeat protein [Candidatus Eisenbacteria bacterium]|nr:tetratricopeptide repeat protein [Candidatus Eisenbacteria bacterium]
MIPARRIPSVLFPVLALLAVLLPAAPARAAATAPDLLKPLRESLKARRAGLERAPAGSLDEARLALETGDFVRARRVLDARDAADTSDFEAAALRGRLDLAAYRFDAVASDLARCLRLGPNHPETRRLLYRWDLVRDDLGSAEARYQAVLASDTTDPVALLFAARVEHLTLRFDSAIAAYRRALRHAASGADSVRSLEGLGACWLQKGDRDAALRYETQALKTTGADDGLLTYLAETLIKLGRANEAMEAYSLAVDLNPCNENAQYMMGNGYARMNYTELRAKRPGALKDSATAPDFHAADSLWDAGRHEEARARLRGLLAARPSLADAHNHLGSYAYEDGDADAAQAEFREALRLCPGYGRAHNGIARSLELYRRGVDIHRQRYETDFAAAAVPDVPGIERFVVNYGALSPRIQKRVALSVTPWKSFVPVLVEGGATFYIKHLHELLSECPAQEALRDQRIGYDLRLWDDVRGCGGYHTVTGIEDVEGTLRGKYNTVLHELTHQVHGVLGADLAREIQEMYRQARSRMDAGQEAFVSLYQASSVWEYLAEGANSLFSPKRDRFDTKEVVKERLEERDPALIAEIHKLMDITDVTPFYAVAYSGAGDDRIERGRAEEALGFYRKAQSRDAASEEVASKLTYALSVLGRGTEAVAVADSGLAAHPSSAGLWLQRVGAEFVRTGDRAAELQALRAARPRVDARERYQVDQAIGRAALEEGLGAEARVAADSVLAYQSDNPEGLQLRAEAEGAAGRVDSARAYFERAVRVRSGLMGLRMACAATFLMQSSRTHGTPAAAPLVDEAVKHVEAARLVDPAEPRVAMMDGWAALARGDLAGARKHLDKATAAAEWLDLAHILRARVRAATGDKAGASAELAPIRARLAKPMPMRYIYNPRQSYYEAVGELGYVERAMVPEANQVPGAR